VSLLWEEEGKCGSESPVGGGRGNVELSLLWEEEG
jgi:hypothetical protein